jgi:hypothetical protein
VLIKTAFKRICCSSELSKYFTKLSLAGLLVSSVDDMAGFIADFHSGAIIAKAKAAKQETGTPSDRFSPYSFS